MKSLIIAALLSIGLVCNSFPVYASADQTTNISIGAKGETACSTDTGSCSLNQLLQRIAQRLSSLITVGGTPIAYVSSAALVANQVIKAGAGSLYSFNVSADSTLSAAAWWVMIYDATSAPTDGAVTPAKCYAMPAGTTGYSAAFFTPITFATGITIGVSTNGCFTKAASTHAFISGDAQ